MGMHDARSHRPVVAVVGLGIAGSLAVVHLCDGSSSHPQNGPIELLLIDPGVVAGDLRPHRDSAQRLLSARVEDMSCYEREADHFARWLCRRGECPSETGLTPTWYRYQNYLAHTVGESIIQATGSATVRRIKNRVEQIEKTDESGYVLYLDNGELCRVDSVVMATGLRCAWEPKDGDRWASRSVDGDVSEPRGSEMGWGPHAHFLPDHREMRSSSPLDCVPLLRREAAKVAASVLAVRAS